MSWIGCMPAKVSDRVDWVGGKFECRRRSLTESLDWVKFLGLNRDAGLIV